MEWKTIQLLVRLKSGYIERGRIRLNSTFVPLTHQRPIRSSLANFVGILETINVGDVLCAEYGQSANKKITNNNNNARKLKKTPREAERNGKNVNDVPRSWLTSRSRASSYLVSYAFYHFIHSPSLRLFRFVNVGRRYIGIFIVQ